MSWQYGGRFRDAARLQGSVRELPLVARVENLQDIFLTFYTDVHGSPVVHDPLAKGMVVRHVFGLEDQRNTSEEQNGDMNQKVFFENVCIEV